jgi:hypothetical protein
MFSTDQTHLRRYFATLGVAIAAGTLSLAGLFLKIQQDLLVRRSTLALLTPTARESILRREEYSIGTLVLPWFVLVGFLGGAGLSTYGMIGWAKRQKISDEREDLGLSRERVEYQKLSDRERVDKLDRDAKESVKASSGPNGTARPDFNTVRSEIATLDHVLVAKLRQLDRGSDVQSSVKLSTPAGQQFEIDAIIENGGAPSIVFELKYSAAASAKNVMNHLTDGLSRLARVCALTGGEGVLVIVVEDRVADSQVADWSGMAAELAMNYKATIGTYVGRYADFLRLSADEFASRVGLRPSDS